MSAKYFSVRNHRFAYVYKSCSNKIYAVSMPKEFGDDILLSFLEKRGAPMLMAEVTDCGRLRVPKGKVLICANTGKVLLDNSVAA